MDSGIVTRIIGYGFGIIALAIFIYSFFITTDNNLNKQAIFWFYSALVASLIPQVKQFKYKDLEVQFRENFQQLEKDMGNKLEKLEQSLLDKVENIKLQEKSLSDDKKERRQRVHTDFAEMLESLPEQQRLYYQEQQSRLNLQRSDLSLAEFKSMLKQAGFYDGEIDDRFTASLKDAIKKFQTKSQLDTVDGIVGRLTILKLSESINHRSTN